MNSRQKAIKAVRDGLRVRYGDGTDAEDPASLILGEEGADALYGAVLDAAAEAGHIYFADCKLRREHETLRSIVVLLLDSYDPVITDHEQYWEHTVGPDSRPMTAAQRDVIDAIQGDKEAS